MGVRAAGPFDLPWVSAYVDGILRDPAALIGCVLPGPLAGRAFAGWPRLVPALFGLRSRMRVWIETHGGRVRSAALVYEGQRP
ncbi:MAG: hypothetical protein ACRDGT_12030, partial [Candidatus Limnocylindria bacterium]